MKLEKVADIIFKLLLSIALGFAIYYLMLNAGTEIGVAISISIVVFVISSRLDKISSKLNK